MTESSNNWSRELMEGRSKLQLLKSLGAIDPRRVSDLLSRCINHSGLKIENDKWAENLLLSSRPRFAAEALLGLADRTVKEGKSPITLTSFPLLPMVLGSSNFLARLLQRSPEMIDEIRGDQPNAPDQKAIAPEWTCIRDAKYRGLLRIAARDLSDRPFKKSLDELSDLADRCLTAGLLCAVRETEVAPPSLLAAGKLGGHELNFSSDVDLIFVYDSALGDKDLKRNHELARLIRHLNSGLEERRDGGFVYRVDLDLRPEGPAGVLANSVSATLNYYESFGADWERQAMLRLRHVAGPQSTSESLIRGLEPFVYRRSIDAGSLRSVKAMKVRIESERNSEGRALDRDLKEGPGGIRDVEFLVQALQLLHGGNIPAVRSGNTILGLQSLAEQGCLPDFAASGLKEAYLWLRRAEHSLQLEEERQVHSIPKSILKEKQLARRMGYRNQSIHEAHTAFLKDWMQARSEIRNHFEALLPGEVHEQD